MGMKFGQLGVRLRGFVFYTISPHEQKAFAGFFSHGIPNMARRIGSNIFRVGPLFLGTYLIIDWGEKENARLSRKDPKEFENDE